MQSPSVKIGLQSVTGARRAALTSSAYMRPTFSSHSLPHLLSKHKICNMYHRAQKVVESGQGLAVLFCVMLFIQRLCACSLFSQPQFDIHADQQLMSSVPCSPSHSCDLIDGLCADGLGCFGQTFPLCCSIQPNQQHLPFRQPSCACSMPQGLFQSWRGL